MSTAAKKPPPGRDPTSPSSSPSRLPPRASAPSGPAAGGSASVTRTRSIRSGTPVSARAAAQRRDSPLSTTTNSADSPDAAADAVEREEAVRAETVALLDDLKDRLAKAEGSSEHYKRQAEVLQSRLDEALQEQAKLEEKVHENEEQLEALKNERREAARQMREMETIYETERSAMMKEKEDMANREEEMQMVIQRLKDSLAQRTANAEDEIRMSRQSNNNSPSVDGGSFAPPSSLHRSDSRNNSKLLLQKDKLIESLRLELAEAQIKLVETENQGGGRLQEVERLLVEARMSNARLMEDNESYQLLLQEKTLNGDFGKSDFSYMSAGSMPANQDALNALEGRGSGTSLADELSEAGEADSENFRRLEAELRSAKDQNKALTLYINKIIERLLQHQDFEHILDTSSDSRPPNTNKDLPPPPAEKAGPSFLQRAKSIAVGASTAARPKPRPMTFMPSTAAAAASAHNNPETAPSIPIGLTRSTSVRRTGRPMSEQFTGGAGVASVASVVNSMYKGADRPLSPSLRGSQIFSPGNRTPSGSAAAPGGNVPMSTSGNFPGETSSTSDDGDVTTPPSQSPPRPGRDHEKTTTFAGNKPRPLRLVQENPEMTRAGTSVADKRASWVAWAFGPKKEENMPPVGTAESIRE